MDGISKITKLLFSISKDILSLSKIKYIAFFGLLILLFLAKNKIEHWPTLAISLIALMLASSLLFFLWQLQKHYKNKKNHATTSMPNNSQCTELVTIHEKITQALLYTQGQTNNKKIWHKKFSNMSPWFMMIGSSNVGKTTLTRHSGLHYASMRKEVVEQQSLDQTENCHFWFANEAVLLDISGRYTDNYDHQDQWLGLLNAINKHDAALLLKGIIVVISMADLIKGESDYLDNQAKLIRNQINDIYQKLHFTLPVFIIFSKTDALDGFKEFFNDLTETEAQQICGVSLHAQQNSKSFQQEYRNHLQELYNRLTHLLLHKFTTTQDVAHKFILYDFPEQFNHIIDKISQLLTLLVLKNPYQDAIALNGMYFTGVISESKPSSLLIIATTCC